MYTREENKKNIEDKPVEIRLNDKLDTKTAWSQVNREREMEVRYKGGLSAGSKLTHRDKNVPGSCSARGVEDQGRRVRVLKEYTAGDRERG